MAGDKDMTTHSVIASDLRACSPYDFGRRAKAWQAGAKQSLWKEVRI